MKKVKLNFAVPQPVELEYNGVKFTLTPFISIAHQAFLINRYVEEYFGNVGHLIGSSEYDYLGAECGLMNYILQGCTNVEVESLDNDIYADQRLWDRIKATIPNYGSFRQNLNYVIEEIKEQKRLKNSLGTVISTLVDKIIPLLNELKDISPEELPPPESFSFLPLIFE